MQLGEKIQTLRKQKGMSQEQLALQLDVSRQSISKWELNQSIPDIDKIILLSDFFHVTTDYLLKDRSMEEKEKTVELVKVEKNNTKWLGMACIFFSTLGFFIIWLLSKIYPAPIVHYNPESKTWNVGLENFIWVHSLENFMNILCLALIIGIGLTFHKQLRKIFESILGKINIFKKI